MKPYKRILSALLSLLCLVSCLSGCKQQPEETITGEVVPTYSTGAMGRYVEKSIPLPQHQYALDMVMLNDGRIRVSLERADGTAAVCTTGPDRETWEHTWEVPEEILATGIVSKLTLSPEGTVFCHTWQDKDQEGNYGFHFWVIQHTGKSPSPCRTSTTPGAFCSPTATLPTAAS